MTNFTVPKEALVIGDNNNLLGTYSFGTHAAKQHFCKNCGIYVFHETRSKPGNFGINIGCLDNVELYDFPASVFDGRNL